MKITHLILLAYISLGNLTPSAFASVHRAYPQTPVEMEAMMSDLSSTVYAPVIQKWKRSGNVLDKLQVERLWRMSRKLEWRQTDLLPSCALAERRIKLLTQKSWQAYQWGGDDESADPAAPFVIQDSDPKPAGMPAGSYAMNSGRIAHYYSSTNAMLRNEEPVSFEIEFQQVARDGRIAIQKKGSTEAGESLGWDGRFEYQPDTNGAFELVITQGAMELPVNLVGASPKAPLSPRVSEHNQFRSRHLFKLRKWVPARRNKLAKLIVRDAGSILGFKPTIEQRYIQMDKKGVLIHAHGYGENFFPDPLNPQKPWIDEGGYLWRAFDMVTRETTLAKKSRSGKIEQWTIPTETRAVAVRMDPKKPFKMDPNASFVFLTSNEIPGTHQPLPATVRYAFNTKGRAIEQRWINEAGNVEVTSTSVPQSAPALLNEGLNFAERPVVLGRESFYIATNSGGEYTSGGLPRPNQKFYGTYLWYRNVKEGRIGAYHPVLTADHQDAKDMFREITQMYGASWGIGRAQIFGGNQDSLWAKAHMVDVDLLNEDQVNFPPSGYPSNNAVFTHAYRRHQIEIPIEIVEENSEPVIQVSDPQVKEDLKAWRVRMNSISR
ncbi:MAG: hypothetical protein H7333_06880 [Bdellovibrionales bacterium]|nr:hypothetical protein [Oligoflexia bacterium]